MRKVAAFYRFVRVADPALARAWVESICLRRGLRGTVLLAHEGINATLVGEARDLQTVIADLERRFGGPERELEVKWSVLGDGAPAFRRMDVKVRNEIVSFGEDVDPTRCTGEHVDVARWHELLVDPDVAVIDTRNAFETGIGTFPGAIGAGTESFREFPAFARERLDPRTMKRVAMFCTGGIRCEKASALLLEQGGLSARRRNPQVSRRGRGRGESLGRRLLRVR